MVGGLTQRDSQDVQTDTQWIYIVYYYKDQSVPMGLKSIKKNVDMESETACMTQVRRSKGTWDRLYLLEMAGKRRRTKFKCMAKI